jgi:hypothetical protein
MRVSSPETATDQVVPAELAVREASAELDDQADQAELEALVEPGVQADQVELAVRAVSVELVDRAVPEEPDDQVVPAELEIDLVEVPAQAIVPGEELVPGIVRVEAVPELDLKAALVKIKWAIAAHPPGLVAVLRGEDSAAVAETTHEQAVTEAATAWAAEA